MNEKVERNETKSGRMRSEERLLNGGIEKRDYRKSIKETKNRRIRMGKIVKDCQAKHLR